MKEISHRFDFCVVGGGIAGLCAAISAARLGARVAIVQDRPVFGGNSSSEMRVHICGADRHNGIPNVRETGILEELRLENLRRNPNKNFSVWDTILYEKVHYQPNLTAFLNCSCLKAEMRGSQIRSITGWQLTTETYHTIEARLFADCSGDGILAPLTGAQFRIGREARGEYGESRKCDSPQPFEPPSWAYRFEKDSDLPYGAQGHRWWEMGYWWIELGGEYDSIHDTEALRDELLKITFGVWDHIKNRGDHGADNWALEWIQFLPAKRESRRYIGDHVLTQLDIEKKGRFPDRVAYGGWSMDDHHPAGFRAVKLGHPATLFHRAPSPFGISYRCLCSRNISNLMFAGRCASMSHAAMSSTRVMGTAAVMGQAVGTAAAIAITKNLSPREVGQQCIDELQQSLLRQDCYLPWVKEKFSDATMRATLSASTGNPAPLRDGVNRPVGADPHAWEGRVGDSVEYTWPDPEKISSLTLIFDSALSRNIQMSYHQKDDQLRRVPEEMVKDFHIEIRTAEGWRPFRNVTGNYQRLVTVDVGAAVTGIRAVFDATWGADKVRLYAFYID
jgi:hypothetical protein